MFDIGWSELLIIGVVALIVIGPKDLPEMFRTLGRFTAKLRSMSRDFQRAMEAAAKETGVNDIAKDVKNMASPKNLGLDAVRSAADRFEKWDPLKPTPAPKPTAAPAAVAPAAASALTPAAVAPSAKAPMGPATAALAEAKAKERAAALASVENRIAAPAVVEPVAAAPAPKVKKSAAAKPSEAAPAKPAKAKAAKPDAETKPRKPRKATPEGDDA